MLLLQSHPQWGNFNPECEDVLQSDGGSMFAQGRLTAIVQRPVEDVARSQSSH